MILTVDIGNTNMEFGIFENNQLKANFRLVTNRTVTSDEIGLFMTQFFSIHKITTDEIEDIIIGSVVPQVMFSVSTQCGNILVKIP